MVVKFRVGILGIKKDKQIKSLFKERSREYFRVFIYFRVASKIYLFLLLSKCESPYKSISFLSLSGKDSKLSSIDFTLFIRSRRYREK